MLKTFLPFYASVGHDHWARIYRFDRATGKFEVVRRYVVNKSQPEIRFPNLLRQIPDFGRWK